MFGLSDRRARAAAKWLARMGNESAQFDREAFERWRAAHPDNAPAFNEAARSWGLDLPVAATHYARETGAGKATGIEGARCAPGSRRIVLTAIAAALVVALVGIGFEQAGMFGGSEHRSPIQFAANFSTKANEARAIRLSDGSTATLGADSELAIAYTKDVRSLTLLRGHARFDVAHDASRPFEVRAGQSLITAHGTVFDVRVLQQGVQVVLLRGAIDVQRVEGTRRTGDVRKLAPGQKLIVPPAGPLGTVEAAAPADTDTLSMLSFDETPLSEAVETVNQGHVRKIVVDAGVRDETITGGFSSDDPDGFAQMIASMFDLALTRGANGDLLLSAKR